MTVTLGLDLGPNSVGWALVDTDADRIVDLGVRIFPEGVDNFDTKKEKPRNEDRQIARSMRRQTRRRAERKRRVKQTLIDLGLFPADPAEQQKLYDADDSNPYALRTRALDEKVSLHELGRILLHINQRRGFKSNRKSERKDGEVKGMLAEMSELEQAIKEGGARTYGEFLYQKSQDLDHTAREHDDHLRGRHTQRDWLTEEFDLIWKAQQEHHPDVLTDSLAFGKLGRLKPIHKPIPKSDPRRNGEGDLESFGLFGLIFFHRTLKPVPREIVGNCELEPKQKRCPRADRQAQKFRLLQEVNNLRMIDGSANPPAERELNEQERALVIDKLSKKKDEKFEKIREWIGKLPDSPAQEQIRFNLEEGKRKSMKGMVTDYLLSRKDAVGSAWFELKEDTRDAVVRDLIDNVDDDVTREKLIDEHGLTAEQAEGALSIDLTEGPTKGYVNFSRLAIGKLLPHLERGLRLMANDAEDSALHAAGYMRRDELQRRIFDELPDPSRIHDAPIGDIPNPVVKRAVVELRKVVNAILREQRRQRDDPEWRPDAVHVEMAREVRQGPKQRKDTIAKISENTSRRDEAKKMIDEINQANPSQPRIEYGSRGINIIRARLWSEQKQNCPYCGQKISQRQLFNDGQVDVDHILPYSRSLDDSQMNKVVCHWKCNKDKGKKTPYEWKAGTDPEGYEQMLQYAKHLPYLKRKRFMQKELKREEFIARQLNATGYIAKATIEYLQCLFSHEDNKRGTVLGLKGQLTAELRRQWELNNLLRDDGLNLKTREDHRHHAVDAIVIALTDRSKLHTLAVGTDEVEHVDKTTGELTYYSAYLGNRIDPPWDNFRDEAVTKLDMLNGGTDEHGQQRGVSHRVQRKVAGALHKDTFYSPVSDQHGRVEGKFAVRKEVSSLTASTIPDICDEKTRELIQHRLTTAGIEFGRGKSRWDKQIQANLGDVANPLCMPPSKRRLAENPDAKGVPIKKVRIFIEEQTIQPIRDDRAEKEGNPDLVAWVKPGATHHLCIFEFMKKGKKKRDAVFVTQLEATNRIKRQQQELSKRMAQWKQDGLNKHEAKRRKAQAMREIAAEFPLIQRDASKLTGEDRNRIPANAEFLMSLSQGELVLADWKGEPKLLKFKTAASTQGQIYFCDHADARKSTEYKKHVATANSLNARKVTIDPLGRVRWASD